MQLTVPYVRQKHPCSCALACLEMAAAFYGVPFDQIEAYGRLKQPVPGLRNQWGVRNSDVIQEAIRIGLDVQADLFNFTNINDMMNQIRQYVDAGQTPIIAAQRSGMTSPLGHSRLIVGWEAPPAGQTQPLVIFHDPGDVAGPGGMVPNTPYKKWNAGLFAGMWNRNKSVAGGEGLVIRRKSP